MAILSGIIIGFVLGLVAAALVDKIINKSAGDIVVDSSDPEDGPYLFLEIHTPMHQFINSEKVTLNVKMKSYISQK